MYTTKEALGLGCDPWLGNSQGDYLAQRIMYIYIYMYICMNAYLYDYNYSYNHSCKSELLEKAG